MAGLFAQTATATTDRYDMANGKGDKSYSDSWERIFGKKPIAAKTDKPQQPPHHGKQRRNRNH
jgi:hypothetical protein